MKFFALSIIFWGQFSNAEQFNCRYETDFKAHKGQRPVLLEAFNRRLKNCNGRNPCISTRSQFTIVEDALEMTIDEVSKDRAACLKAAELNCHVVRLGIIESKSVRVSFEGKLFKKMTCFENGQVKKEPLELTSTEKNPTKLEGKVPPSSKGTQ